jgi:organic radical activating enzyme
MYKKREEHREHKKFEQKKINFQVFEETYVPKISQTFLSLEGEGQNVGEPSIYVRTAGCYSAACKFCDTKFSWYNKKKFPYVNEDWWKELITENFEDKISKIERLTITGGEPLHYMKSLYKIIDVFKNNEFEDIIKIKWLGIESNGNILKDKENLFELLKVFNSFKKSGIEPILTISPKLDSRDCYNSQISNQDIIKMYKDVIENITSYFPYNVNFKFIWEAGTRSNDQVSKMLKILKGYGISGKNIYLMPFTPKDPLGINNENWERIKDITARDALKFGVRYSPRIHIDRKLD